ncbi:MAG: ATP-dependent Clp protease adaptor protein ClpS [Saprospiraceae bacterium]|jgi:ATP-dependent Clp protease adaptor protein ClpS
MSENDQDNLGQGGTGLVVEPAKPKLKKPPMYKVVMLNDDYTPMEFVILVLENLFRMDHELAMQIMMNVHQKGKGVCGVYPHEIAETKIAQVTELARTNEHPLQCTLEEA